ncbi:MAG: 2OG-Fe(II) oxygenase [Alphaproteobacteria bacterium]
MQNATPATAQRLHMLAGQPVVLHFFGNAPESDRRAVLEAVDRRADIFDGQRALFVGVSGRASDRAAMEPFATGAISLVWDFDSRVAAQYGLNVDPTPTTLLLDAGLRIVARIVSPSAATQIDALVATLRDHLAWARLAVSVPPVLVVPGIFEPVLCQRLIDTWENGAKTDSGFMREQAGKTVLVVDHRFKRRIDVSIADPLLRTACLERVRRRLLPAVERAFQYRATRMERYMVAAYDRGSGGWFRPHRDNTTRGTAHRRFAVTINLNAEAFEGGDLRFPEFGRQTWRASTGGAIVFSCSLLHEVVPVTAGRRFAFLPFLYDEAAAAQRTANNVYLDDALKPYPGQSEGGAA